MHWDDLRIFLAVARSESLTGAGRALRMDPATVGRRVARLEEQLGTRLFVKSPQGYVPTPDGERLQARAEQAEQAFDLGVEEVQGQAGRLTGTVRIGAPDGAANYVLPQVCASICDDNPGLEIQIVALPRVFNLSKREADLAISVSRPETGDRLTVQKLSDYGLHLAASDEYLARNPPITALADLKQHRMVGYIPDMIFDKELDYLADTGSREVALASNSVSVQFNWIRQGGGVGIIHDFTLPTAPNVQRILMDQFSLSRCFYLIRHRDDRRVTRLDRFANALAERFRTEIQRLEGMA